MYVYRNVWQWAFWRPNFVIFGRNSNRLGNGVLYASVNPEYFSAADGELLGYPHCWGTLSGELLGVLL